MVQNQLKRTEIESELWDLRAKIAESKKRESIKPLLELIKKGLKSAKKLHLNKLHFEFAETLHYYALIHFRDVNLSKKAKEELNTAKELREAEERARFASAELNGLLQVKGRADQQLKELYNRYSIELEPLLQYTNINISMFVYQILIDQAYFTCNYNRVISLSEKAIQFFDSHKTQKSQHYKIKLLPFLIFKGQYDRVQKLIDSSKNQRWGQKFSGSVFLIYEVCNKLHQQKYQEAYTLLCEAEKKRSVNPALSEQWIIIKGFFRILTNAGIIKNDVKYRIGKVLNEVPEFNKDKYGNFINILILKSIIRIQEDKGKAIENREAIERAAIRYTGQNSRERLFLKMLLSIPRLQFDKDKILKCNTEYLSQLRTSQQNVENLDIIPWCTLWDIVLGSIN